MEKQQQTSILRYKTLTDVNFFIPVNKVVLHNVMNVGLH